ncbi:MAG: HNH endonuclease [Actinobacteria bacterium]|nr:HNH endonuclease [Actinomycetota bacterium]
MKGDFLLDPQAGEVVMTALAALTPPRREGDDRIPAQRDCVISRVFFGADSQPLDIGRASRVIPPSLARAVIARDRHCQHPGCGRPARWCDIHHLIH